MIVAGSVAVVDDGVVDGVVVVVDDVAGVAVVTGVAVDVAGAIVVFGVVAAGGLFSFVVVFGSSDVVSVCLQMVSS